MSTSKRPHAVVRGGRGRGSARTAIFAVAVRQNGDTLVLGDTLADAEELQIENKTR